MDWNWHYGCEPLVYVWDYPENGPTNKFFRNGELKWAEFGQFERSKAYHNANENDFWSNGCKAVWDNQARKGGWIYSGVYQVGQNFYNDKGTDSSAPLITKPSPEPEPIAKTDIWLEALGFKGEAWCSVGKTCNTGWVTGPSVKVECPADKKLVNRGTLYSKWDGLKRFEGKTDCEGATGEASPRDGTDAFKTDQTSLWTREGTLLKNFGNMYNPRIIIDEGSEFKYKMWFFGWAKEDCNENVLHGNGCDAIFHARSKDSKNWEIYSGKDSNNNPIFDSTMNPSLWIPVISAQDKYYDQWHNGDPSVIKVGNNYYMAYSATGFDLDGIGYERQGDKDGDFYDIMGAVSANGIDWTKTSKPLLVYEKEAGAVDDINHGVAIMNGMYHRPSLMYEDGKFRLWFDYWNDRVDMGYAEMQAASTSDAFLTGTWNIINAGSNPAIKQWPNPNVIRAGNKYYSYSDPPDPSYGSSNGEGWQWKARKIAEAVSDDGISWKVTGYINPDPDCPATHVPEAYYENGKIYVGYACQKGGNPYDYRYGEIRKMWKQVADNEILAELFGGTLTTELGTHGTGNVYAPDVLYENGIYKMWYGGQGNDGHDRIHYAESADGITWDKKGVVLDNGNSNHVNDPSVVKVDGTYYMYYTDANVAENDRIHLATSTDGKTWVKKGIVLDVGPFQWNSRIVGRPSVMKQGSLWMMWYDTNDGVTSYVGYATSSDGMVWVKYQDPLLTGMGDVDVKKIGDLYYMIFGLRDGTHIATSQFGLSWTYRGLWFRKSGSIFDNFGHVSPFFYVDQNNNPNAIYFGGASIAPHHGNSMGIIRLNGDELNNLPPPSRFRGRIQGIKVKMPGNVQDAIPPSQETVYLDDALPTKTNPYFLDDVPAGAHKVSVTVPQGWSVGYTQCTNRVDCHQDVPTSGNSVNVNVPENGYVDLWWHYTQTVRCGNGNKEGTEECDDGNTNNGDGCTSDCKLERCTDGTFYNQCSSIKPKFCANGNLRNDCQNCGCLDNQECQRDGSCVANSCTTLDYNGDPKNKLDLLYIGDAYLNSDQVKFANDVNIFIRGLLDYEPFKSQRNKINFYRIDNTHDLACQYNCGGLKKLICCDWSKVEQAAAHCPHDYVFIIVNNDTYGGSGGYYSVSYRGNYNVSVHEFGHSFGGLSDEYVRGSCPSCDSKEKVNCDGTPDCPKWSNLPNTNCVKGCTYEEWYRPRENHSMMLDLNGSFNPVGERHLSKLMEAYS
ncbi:hypothetical protein HYS31_00155 [Candidatus Woesearchaeota archaeon]|nr:hypothetical protein [Candidatus Woesearchaeota archaeon]